jgi:hypothetical protein
VWSNCKVVEDSLKWFDHETPTYRAQLRHAACAAAAGLLQARMEHHKRVAATRWLPSGLLISRNCRIPSRSCHPFPHLLPLLAARTIHRGNQLDGHLGTKACLRCTSALATVLWDSLLATQGQLPARANSDAVLLAPTELVGLSRHSGCWVVCNEI